jgi:hypothetical protein
MVPYPMPTIKCYECGKGIYLDSRTYWTINDARIKCELCGYANTITLEKGELRKQS